MRPQPKRRPSSLPPPLPVKVVRPNVVDQLKKGETELEELLPLTSLQAIPAAGTKEGKLWRGEKATQLRKRIAALTNQELYPETIRMRAGGLLRAFENRVVQQGHDRWWVTDTKPQRRKRRS